MQTFILTFSQSHTTNNSHEKVGKVAISKQQKESNIKEEKSIFIRYYLPPIIAGLGVLLFVYYTKSKGKKYFSFTEEPNSATPKRAETNETKLSLENKVKSTESLATSSLKLPDDIAPINDKVPLSTRSEHFNIQKTGIKKGDQSTPVTTTPLYRDNTQVNPSNKQHKYVGSSSSRPEKPLTKKEKEYLKRIAKIIKSGKAKATVFTGAGISVEAGIPAFRGSKGFYSLVKKYYQENNKPIPKTLPYAGKYYTKEYLEENPKDFYAIFKKSAKLKCGKPTYTHKLLRLMSDKSLLLHYFTQNVDALEDLVGLPSEKMSRYHGQLGQGSYCLKCNHSFSEEELAPFYETGEAQICKKVRGTGTCNGVLKFNNVVFFDDPIHQCKNAEEKIKDSNIVFIIGTSLQVSPFRYLPHYAKKNAYRVFIAKEVREKIEQEFSRAHDIVIANDCDYVLRYLFDELLGWKLNI